MNKSNLKNTVTKGSGNIFNDIGCKNPDALKVKAQIAVAINSIVKHRHTTQKEAVEGRLILAKDFLEQYFAARNMVNKLKLKFSSKIKVDLLLKNTDNSNKLYKAGIDQIDNHLPEKYTRLDLESLLGLT